MGLLTAALAIAAHAMAQGAAPPGAAAALLSVLAVTAGAVAANTNRTADARVLFALLAVGQLVAHVMLTVAGHTHCAASGGSPAAAMLAAHAVRVGGRGCVDRRRRPALPGSDLGAARLVCRASRRARDGCTCRGDRW